MKTTFELPLRFECLTDCGLCCSYRVDLSSGDADLLKKCNNLPDVFAIDGHLKKANEYCCFLDSKARCSVYKNRPLHCRIFPFYFETQEEIDVDFTCPGIGAGEEISDDYFNKIKTEYNQRTNIQTARLNDTENLHIISKCLDFISRDEFIEAGISWCSSLNKSDSFETISDKVCKISKERSTLPYLQNDFDEFWVMDDVRNVHIETGKKPVKYHCRLEQNGIIINSSKFLFEQEPENTSILKPEQLDVITKYLKVWFKRSIFYRFCLITSLPRPSIDSPFGMAFKFLLVLLERIIFLKNNLKQYWSEKGQINEIEILREAIRLFDGRLRTKCRAVCLQTSKLT